MASIPSWDGTKVGKATIDDGGLGDVVKKRLMRSAVIQYEANKRQGTVKTKTRGETAYTGNKPFRQKGTGNARRGDRNSPVLRGGGTIFGPRPRSYRQSLPRKALREALRSALLAKLRDEHVAAIPSKAFGEPSTKAAVAALTALDSRRSAMIVIPSGNDAVWKSFRNLPKVEVARATDVNAHQVMSHDHIVLVDDAWDVLMKRLAGAGSEEAAS